LLFSEQCACYEAEFL